MPGRHLSHNCWPAAGHVTGAQLSHSTHTAQRVRHESHDRESRPGTSRLRPSRRSIPLTWRRCKVAWVAWLALLRTSYLRVVEAGAALGALGGAICRQALHCKSARLLNDCRLSAGSPGSDGRQHPALTGIGERPGWAAPAVLRARVGLVAPGRAGLALSGPAVPGVRARQAPLAKLLACNVRGTHQQGPGCPTMRSCGALGWTLKRQVREGLPSTPPPRQRHFAPPPRPTPPLPPGKSVK